MDPNYQNSYRWSNTEPVILKEQIQRKFANYDLNKQYGYDQLLFILDEKSHSGNCDRDVTRQLFLQLTDLRGKTTLNEMVLKYVQNLQTTKLCLLREESTINYLNAKSQKLVGQRKAYAYIKLLQATVHARYSSIPVFSYKIEPTDIPSVTLVNSLNPILNHEYTLQLEQNQFSIIFMESGIPTYTWNWPDQHNVKRGQYRRTVNAEGVSFDLEIKYMPIGSNQEKDEIQEEIWQRQERMRIQKSAFEKLCSYQPFLNQRNIVHKEEIDRGFWWNFTQKINSCLPFMDAHVRNLYYMCIMLILVQCLASVSWPMEFLDLVLIFSIIGMLYDQSRVEIGFQLWITMGFMVLLVLKSIWGIMTKTKNAPHFGMFLGLAIGCKIILILFIWFTSVRKQEYPFQRDYFFYGKKQNKNYSFSSKRDRKRTDIQFQ